MSSHDLLMSKFMELKALLEEYTEEYDPVDGKECLFKFMEAYLLANDFAEGGGEL